MSCLTLSFFSLKMYIDKGLAPSLITLIASLTDSTLTIGKMGPKINPANINNKITSNSFFSFKKKEKNLLTKNFFFHHYIINGHIGQNMQIHESLIINTFSSYRAIQGKVGIRNDLMKLI